MTELKKVVSLAGVSDYRSRFLEGTPHFEQWEKDGVTYVENTRTKQQLPHNFSFYEDFIANQEKLTIKTATQAINIPHLIVHGDNDSSVTLAEGQNINRWNPNSQLFVVKDADHVFGLKHPWEQDTLSPHMQEAIDKVLSFFMAPA